MKFNIDTKLRKQFKNRKTLVLAVISVLIVIAFVLYQSDKPESLNGQVNQAQALTKEGKVAFALNIYLKLAKQYPDNYDIHCLLGKAYLSVNEPDKAKVEFYRAQSIDQNKPDALFALNDLYASQEDWGMAEDVVSQFEKTDNRRIAQKMGDFYFVWASNLLKTDQLDGLRKYKVAYEYYKIAKSKNLPQIQKVIADAYINVADSLISINKPSDAIRILNLLLYSFDNALARYKLGLIYGKFDLDKALSEYKQAFALNKSVSSPDPYIVLLVKKGNILSKKGDAVQAKYYYTVAKNLNPKAQVPYIPDKHILVNLVAGRFSDDDNGNATPGISFKITNVSKDPIYYLRAKVVFKKDNDNNKIGEEMVDVAADGQPIQADMITETYEVFSSNSIKKKDLNGDIKIEIYISQKNPDVWRLYRQAYLATKR